MTDTESQWLPIAHAPKDGSPVWARGHEYGNPGQPMHAGWVFWSEERQRWAWASYNLVEASYVTEFMPAANYRSATDSTEIGSNYLRDRLAAAALPEVFALFFSTSSRSQIATEAYQLADAMMAARSVSES